MCAVVVLPLWSTVSCHTVATVTLSASCPYWAGSWPLDFVACFLGIFVRLLSLAHPPNPPPLHVGVLTHMARVADMRVQSRPRVPVAEWTPEFVDFLQQHHGWLLRLDVAPSTQRVYDASVRRYMSFCEKLGVQAVPDPTWVSQFVLGCTCANFALSTIRVSVATLRRWAADEFGSRVWVTPRWW